MRNLSELRWLCALGIAALMVPVAGFGAEDDGDDDRSQGKRLEEVVVYGERVEATVSDTSIAITALDNQFVDDMGLQGPDEMINFIPAATRTAWDIKIRGVGRNFRGLGGDPGIGTYYNGAYSPDFGIASTEGALYDVNRIEILRGPQGTLYGRNSIGGVVNYVTNQPNPDEFEAQARVIVGKYNTREFYGFISGPVTDNLAYRLVGVNRLRDEAIDGLMSEDVGNVDDSNIALTLDWQATDNIKVNVRGNDRSSDNNGNFASGGRMIVSEGPCVGQHPITDADDCDPRYRVDRDTNHYASGFRPVSEAYFNTYGDLATIRVAPCPGYIQSRATSPMARTIGRALIPWTSGHICPPATIKVPLSPPTMSVMPRRLT